MARYLVEEIRINVIVSAQGGTFTRADTFFNHPISITNGALIVSGDDSLIGDFTSSSWDVTGLVESTGGYWVTKYDTYIQAGLRISRGVVPVGGTGRRKMSLGSSSVTRYYNRIPSASGSGVFFDSLYLPASPSGSYAPTPNYIIDGQTITNGCEMTYDPSSNYIEFALPGVYARAGQQIESAGNYVEYKFACNVSGISLTSSKPSKDDPVNPTLTQINRIFLHGIYAHVYYTYAGVNYTEILVKGTGPICWGLGDGYIKRALIFDKFAWVYIGNDKYLCKSIGGWLNVY